MTGGLDKRERQKLKAQKAKDSLDEVLEKKAACYRVNEKKSCHLLRSAFGWPFCVKMADVLLRRVVADSL